jgi:hypothetical protein
MKILINRQQKYGLHEFCEDNKVEILLGIVQRMENAQSAILGKLKFSKGNVIKQKSVNERKKAISSWKITLTGEDKEGEQTHIFCECIHPPPPLPPFIHEDFLQSIRHIYAVKKLYDK